MNFIKTTLKEIKQNMKKAVLLTIVVAGVSFLGLSVLSKPTYVTSTELIVKYEKTGEETGMDAINASRNLATLYESMIDHRQNYKFVQESMNLEDSLPEISDRFEIKVEERTPIIHIQASAHDDKISEELIETFLSNPVLAKLLENEQLEFVRGELSYDTKMVQKSPITLSILVGVLSFFIFWIYIFISNSLSSSIISSKQIEDLTSENVDFNVTTEDSQSLFNLSELIALEHLQHDSKYFLLNTFHDVKTTDRIYEILLTFGYKVGYFEICGNQEGHWSIKDIDQLGKNYSIEKNNLADFKFDNLEDAKEFDIVLLLFSAKDSLYSYTFSHKADQNYLLVSQGETKDRELIDYVQKAKVFDLTFDRILLTNYEEKNDIY